MREVEGDRQIVVERMVLGASGGGLWLLVDGLDCWPFEFDLWNCFQVNTLAVGDKSRG